MRKFFETHPQLITTFKAAVRNSDLDHGYLMVFSEDKGFVELFDLKGQDNWKAGVIHGVVVAAERMGTIQEVRFPKPTYTLTPYSINKVLINHGIAIPAGSHLMIWIDKQNGLVDQSIIKDFLDIGRVVNEYIALYSQKSILYKRVDAAATVVEGINNLCSLPELKDITNYLCHLASRITNSQKAFIAVQSNKKNVMKVITVDGDVPSNLEGRSFDILGSFVGLALKNKSDVPTDGIYRKPMPPVLGKRVDSGIRFGDTLLIIPTKEVDPRDSAALVLSGGVYLDRHILFYLRQMVDILASKIKALRLFNEALEKSMFDPLTNLYTRSAALYRLNELLANASRTKKDIGVLMIDLDKFKAINDTYGHQIGDRVLEYVAHQVRSRLRPSDIAARYGGEEFLVILPDTPKNMAIEIAQRIRMGVESGGFPSNAGMIQVTVSIGVFSSYKDSPDVMIREADKRLYKAKELGRNTVVD